LGRNPKELPPGAHLLLPLVNTVDLVNTVPWTDELAIQSLTTKDSKSVHVAVSLTCVVVDVIQYQIWTESGADSLQEAARGVVSDVVRRNRSDRFLTGKCDAALLRSLQAESLEWGVEVRKVRFPSRVEAPTVRLLGVQA